MICLTTNEAIIIGLLLNDEIEEAKRFLLRELEKDDRLKFVRKLKMIRGRASEHYDSET